MKTLSKADLERTAKELLAKGYKVLFATHDGQYFTDRENAAANAKTIGSEVYTFTRESVSEDDLARKAADDAVKLNHVLGGQDPPASDPPAGDPPAGDPPAGDPPAGDPPAGDPPAGNRRAAKAGSKKTTKSSKNKK